MSRDDGGAHLAIICFGRIAVGLPNNAGDTDAHRQQEPMKARTVASRSTPVARDSDIVDGSSAKTSYRPVALAGPARSRIPYESADPKIAQASVRQLGQLFVDARRPERRRADRPCGSACCGFSVDCIAAPYLVQCQPQQGGFTLKSTRFCPTLQPG